MRGKIQNLRFHGCINVESAVPAESLEEAGDWDWKAGRLEMVVAVLSRKYVESGVQIS